MLSRYTPTYVSIYKTIGDLGKCKANTKVEERLDATHFSVNYNFRISFMLRQITSNFRLYFLKLDLGNHCKYTFLLMGDNVKPFISNISESGHVQIKTIQM